MFAGKESSFRCSSLSKEAKQRKSANLLPVMLKVTFLSYAKMVLCSNKFVTDSPRALPNPTSVHTLTDTDSEDSVVEVLAGTLAAASITL